MKTLTGQAKGFKFYPENNELMLQNFMHVRSKTRFSFEKVNLEDELEIAEGETQAGSPVRRLLHQSEQKQ